MKLRLVKLIEVFENAGSCERLMPRPKGPATPSMYDLLEVSYEPKDYGYWNNKKPLKLRANSKQIECWELAIDLMRLLELDERRLVWSRALRYSWVQLGKKLGLHRTTVKKRYVTALLRIESQADKKTLARVDRIN